MSSQYPVCPNCKQTDTVKRASQANVSMPLKPSDTVVKIVQVWRWVFGGIFALIILIVVIELFSGSFLLCFAPIQLLIGVIIVLVPWLVGKYVNQNYQKRYDEWRRAIDKYQKLWFCARCVGVWLEGQNRVVPIEHIQSFLYEIQHEI